MKHLDELHGGTVRADSAGEGRGATFTVTLPAAAAAVATPSAPAEPRRGADDGDGGGPGNAAGDARPDPRAQLDGVQVLVVDDEPDAREVLGSLLRRCGADVTVAASAAEAMRSIRTGWPDVLLSDIGMPGEDGYSLIRQVRAMESERRGLPGGAGADALNVDLPLPAVALTAFAARDDRRRALNEGFQMHVPKPVEPAELAKVVASLAGRG